jgi:CRISPR-associated endonuclease Csy4
MQHYVEIRILPDPEFAQAMLMSALYSKLHRALVQDKNLQIGVSFPGYQVAEGRISQRTLGDKLRLHGSEVELNSLLISNWLIGMRDHVEISSIYPVTKVSGYVICKRRQAASNVERLRRRYIKRHSISREEAKQQLPDSIEERLTLPFVQLKSRSTGEDFRLFIEQLSVDTSQEGEFNSYGLSKFATVPKIEPFLNGSN